MHDVARDKTTIPIVVAALELGMPILAICRGIQELNVALGGTLHQRLSQVSDSLSHNVRHDVTENKYLPRHGVKVAGGLAEMLGTDYVLVNSLHDQSINVLAKGLTAEAWASDGTIEGVRVTEAKSFAYGVQWHPEWRCANFQNNLALFRAFGYACRDYKNDRVV